MQTVTVQQLAQQHAKSPIDLIDVRTPSEFCELHVALARNIPIDTLDPAQILAARPSAIDDDPIYVICQNGSRSTKAVKMFHKAGFCNIVNVTGGTAAWQAAGLSIKQGKKTVSLERQVRIAAGMLVLLGILLSNVVHPYFVSVAIFVGAGLIFAGVTDTCGMGMILGKMPWNRVCSR